MGLGHAAKFNMGATIKIVIETGTFIEHKRI
jgi:hypothetical protein